MEIKFRVWDEISKTMWNPEQGGNYFITQIGVVCTDETNSGGILENRSYRSKAMLFTGLKDKNGVDIYEGDILSSGISGNVTPFVVEWTHKNRWSGMADGYRVHNIGFYIEEYYFRLHECLVIGNIYQNPELLK